MPVEQISGEYNATPKTLGDGQPTMIQTDAQGRILTAGAGTPGGTSGGVSTVQTPADGATTTTTTVTMTGASASLVTASATRLLVRVSNAEANAAAAIRTDGGTCALDVGIPIPAGTTIEIRGKEAQQAMTQIGTNSQKLTVTTGF